ncbi:hypothetical protein C8F01DRAFT_1162721 [Mycena amicta]|nr:hypothetical protein C8F01DRAFT_1162721 [Mycena amicta]
MPARRSRGHNWSGKTKKKTISYDHLTQNPELQNSDGKHLYKKFRRATTKDGFDSDIKYVLPTKDDLQETLCWFDARDMDVFDQAAPKRGKLTKKSLPRVNGERLNELHQTLFDNEGGYTKEDYLAFRVAAPATNSSMTADSEPSLYSVSPSPESASSNASESASSNASELVTMIDIIKDSPVLIPGFLEALYNEAKAQNSEVEVGKRAIAFVTAAKANYGLYDVAPFHQLYPLHELSHMRTHARIIMGLVILPASSVTLTKQQWALEPWHANVLIIERGNGRRGCKGSGKTVFICEPNVIGGDLRQKPLTLTALVARRTIKRRVKDMVQAIHPTKIFINRQRSTFNREGICLQLALKWMVEIVMNGIEIKKDTEGRVVSAPGFVEIGLD